MESSIVLNQIFSDIHFNPQILVFFLYILCRSLGIFFISPLLSDKSLTTTSRIYLGLFIAFLFSQVLYPQYQSQFDSLKFSGEILGTTIVCMEELAIGYLLGFCFNIVFEGMALAGELIDNMIGFSTAQFLNPLAFSFHSSMAMLMVFTGALYMLITDYHHVFVRILAESFALVPIGDFHMPPGLLVNITDGTSWIYSFGIRYGAIPVFVLIINLVGVALTVKVVPEMNLLLTGLPLRVLFGLWSMMLAMSRIFPLFGETFRQVTRLVESMLLQMGG